MAAQQKPFPFRPAGRVDEITRFGPNIDALGDIHGCTDAAVSLLGALGHQVSFPADPNAPAHVIPAPGRGIILVGDLTDRGPRSPDALRLMEGLLESGAGFGIMGNHDAKLMRALAGAKLTVGEELEGTLAALEGVAPATRDRWRDMLHGLPHQIRTPTAYPGGDGQATFVHAAAPTHHQDVDNKHSLQRALYGYADGSTDSHGHLIREDWAEVYAGLRLVVHGHTPLPQPRLKNRVACIDTGAVFGNSLSALSIDTMAITQVTTPFLGYDRPGVSNPTQTPGTIRRFLLQEDTTRSALAREPAAAHHAQDVR